VLGKDAKDRTVKKAVLSKGEFEPKQKHVRKAILGISDEEGGGMRSILLTLPSDCWKENGCSTFLRLLTLEPIDSDAVCAFKGRHSLPSLPLTPLTPSSSHLLHAHVSS
jgi:hypothetical protein